MFCKKSAGLYQGDIPDRDEQFVKNGRVGVQMPSRYLVLSAGYSGPGTGGLVDDASHSVFLPSSTADGGKISDYSHLCCTTPQGGLFYSVMRGVIFSLAKDSR
ncbi:hypothetical protein W822_18270 [Advenella kashmirensis W13003]|uniref:Uncharacterized protein n=1 Tax=Advenella kashmirensis W13003 TaxID=1424334 RepID=V8QP33_9BURK|nr:hypothetical protein W822_18270 [Advenella kashmirensis W13003]